ncbi:hypothetical protein [uncultured virus]|uniref:Uncharacterized protein n=1 Tax=uncultured virus TaxID=340016 RepID=A0A218MM82_9VIRU|nr:hypothetical protein [uncultured virus]
MALSTAKHEPIHDKTGDDLAAIKANFDNGKHLEIINFPAESAIIYQIQKMQDELDYLRGIIDTNNDKVSMTLGTSGSTALAGDTNIVTIGSSTTVAFGDMITVPAKGKVPASYSIVMTVTNGGVSKTITHTLT